MTPKNSSQYQDWMHYVLPTITLASVSTAYAARIMRSQLLDVMNQDYIRTAKAKGVHQYKIIFVHALRNALIPVITYVGPMIGGILTGSMVIESIFNICNEVRAYHDDSKEKCCGHNHCVITVCDTAYELGTESSDIVYKVIDPRIKLD